MKLFGLLSLIASGLVFSACGEETVCEKARAIEWKFCKDYQDCFPCACLAKGKDYVMKFKPPPFNMQVDIASSGCVAQRLIEYKVLYASA